MEIIQRSNGNAKWLLLAILILAAVLRFWGLERGDPMNDEVTYAFRAIGLVDSFNDPGVQSTPWEWFDPNIPSWAKFSFHDHPPLVFWVQSLFMRVFGESRVAFRLASAIFGILSVLLVYLLVKQLYGYEIRKSYETTKPVSYIRTNSYFAALIAAALLAVSANHVYVSRVGLQESYVIFFILLAFYLFLRALENDKYFIWTGIAVGFGLLTKYTAGIIIPVFITYLFIQKRQYLLNKKLWLGAILALAILSPVIIYNLGLYRASGHFDLQFSYFLGKLPEVWAKTPGKDIGSLYQRVNIFLPRLIMSQSWLFLGVFALGISAFLAALAKNSRETLKRHGFLVMALFFTLTLIAATGPALRFLTLLTPLAAVAAALALDRIRIWLGRNGPSGWPIVFAAFISFEIFYAVNNQILFYPIGPRPWLSSALRYENYNWGYNALDDWLEQELKGKIPALTFETKYKFISAIQDKNLKSEKNKGAVPYPLLLITYGNFDLAAELWLFDRRLLYHGWPIMPYEEYERALTEKGPEVWRKAGFEHLYLVMQTNIVPSPEFIALTRELTPTPILNPRGEETFIVYKF